MCKKFTFFKILGIYLTFAEFFKKIVFFWKNTIFLIFYKPRKTQLFFLFSFPKLEESKFFRLIITFIVFLIEFLIL